MSIVDCASGSGKPGGLTVPLTGKVLQRLAEVRELQGISRRTVARQLNVEVSEIRRQEEQNADLPLSKLYDWQKALAVPISELLVESQDALSPALMQRAQMIRLMKTVLAILEKAEGDAIRLMAQTFADQLIEVMPELCGVTAWHTVGKRRGLDDLGVAAQRSLSDGVFGD